MTDFLEKNIEEQENDIIGKDVEDEVEEISKESEPIKVQYCPRCTLPPEFCEYGQLFEECLPWILKNCKTALSPDVLSKLMEKASLEAIGDQDGIEKIEKEEKKKSKKGNAGPKKKAALGECCVVISRIQRQKKKFVTSVRGLETVPDLKIKDAAKIFGKKFSSGASISDIPGSKDKEVTIQGDVSFDLPALLMSDSFKIAASSIFFMEGDVMRPCLA
jgi:density-regulated protein DRP1